MISNALSPYSIDVKLDFVIEKRNVKYPYVEPHIYWVKLINVE